MSLSARRAWIEIFAIISLIYQQAVALRKESVDRNYFPSSYPVRDSQSLSARRAWIEIETLERSGDAYASLSARRAWIEIS